jgi:hypothetical protein
MTTIFGTLALAFPKPTWILLVSIEKKYDDERKAIENYAFLRMLIFDSLIMLGILSIYSHAVLVEGVLHQKIASRFGPVNDMRHTRAQMDSVTLWWREVVVITVIIELCHRCRKALRWDSKDNSAPQTNEALGLYMMFTWLVVWLLVKVGFFSN